MTHDFLDLDAVGQRQLVQSGQISEAELLDATLARVERMNAAYNFLASTDCAAARDRVRGAPADGGLPRLGLLMKDVVPALGLRLELGSRLFAGQVSNDRTPYTDALNAAGWVPFGKTTVSELGLLGSTETVLHGQTLNPWNVQHSAGGSSGGAAVAVACRAVPVAHGTDGGGSIRIPASLSGVFGLKPSRGRTHRSAVMATPLAPLLSDHCLSISVRDSASFLAATEIRGSDGPLAPVGFIAEPHRRRLRIGVYDRTLMGEGPEREVAASFVRGVRLLEDLGHDVEEVHAPPANGEQISDTFFTLAGAVVAGLESMVGQPLTDAVIEPFTLDLLDWYRSRPQHATRDALAGVETIATQILSLVQRYDVLMSPTVPIVPPKLGFLAPDLPFQTAIDRMQTIAGYTSIHNLAGLPAASVPLYRSDSGMPIGLHFTADVGQEGSLLGLAYQLEEACPWADRRPTEPA